MKKKILKYFQYKNFYFFVCLIFVVQFYDGFLNIYIILKNNYEERMIRHGGYCEKQAYGFTYHINKKYKNLSELNIPVINFFLEFPTTAGYFFDTNKKETDTYLIIVNLSDEDIKKKYFKDYQVVEQNQNCYFLKKK